VLVPNLSLGFVLLSLLNSTTVGVQFISCTQVEFTYVIPRTLSTISVNQFPSHTFPYSPHSHPYLPPFPFGFFNEDVHFLFRSTAVSSLSVI